jgi:hypothetical protein
MRTRISLIVLAAILAGAPALAAEECEKRPIAILYTYPACNKNVGWLNFWASDLSPLEHKAQPDQSFSCRKSRFAPHGCVAEKRDPDDFIVIVEVFVNKKHFCNFTLPRQVKDNLVSGGWLQLGEREPNELQPLKASGPPSRDNYYYAPLPPFGDALLRCDSIGGACKLHAVMDDGERYFEIQFPDSARARWRELLEKTQKVAAKCV